MPARNTIRQYDTPAFYHVYNRGAGGQSIFRNASDKSKFISLLQRYLSDDEEHSTYPTYDIELLAFCIMGNHYHLLLYQEADPTTITHFMRSISTAYSMYYNAHYKSQGHVFQSTFRASRITNDAYLMHISRYIHLNPKTYKTYKWSSLAYYLGKDSPKWLSPYRVLDMSPAQYTNFLEDYEDKRLLLKEIKDELAF